MSIMDELIKYEDYLIRAYEKCKERNATLPEKCNLYNLATCVESIPTSVSYKTMTVQIDMTNSDPETALTYADDAEGMTPGDNAWDDFFGHYPVLFKNSIEVGKLNPNNFYNYKNGTPIDIVSGDTGDVMIAFPRRGIRIFTNGNILTVSMTDNPNDSNFTYYAHTKGEESKDKFYLGAYKGYLLDGKLRSLAEKDITNNEKIDAFRGYAQANGEGYEQSGFYQLIFRQCMYILKYKNLDSQNTVGYGYVEANHTGPIATGGTETWGMDCELIKESNSTYMTDQEHHMKLFGLEDFWGNTYEWIDGVIIDENMNILTSTTDFNNAGTGYVNQGAAAATTDKIYGYMTKAQGTSETGFLVKETTGNATQVWEHYCDIASMAVSCGARFGGFWKDTTAAGCFLLSTSYSLENTSSYMGSRLMYL